MNHALPAPTIVRGAAGIRRSVAALLVLLTVIGLSGCARAGGTAVGQQLPMTLTIVSEDWNGWDENHQSTPITKTLRVAPDASLDLEYLGDSMTLTVSRVSGTSVEFRTSEQMAPAGDSGGINLNDLQSSFTVRTETPVEFSTASLDGGISYTVTLARD